MNLEGTQVQSAVFGTGVVRACEGDILHVDFPGGTKKFSSPSCFERFLTAVDPEVQAQIQKQLAQTAQAEAAKKQKALAEEAQRAAQDRQEQARRAAVRKSGAAGVSAALQNVRARNVPLPFFVSQGTSYLRESAGGYIWAPITDASGKKHHYWEMMTQVQPGDLLFHGCGAKIMAISVALGASYAANQPKNLVEEKLWDLNGRRIDCSYVLLQNTVDIPAFRADIQKLRFDKYNAFKSDGSGNQGYLFELPVALAAAFLRGIVENNPSVGELEPVRQLVGADQ